MDSQQDMKVVQKPLFKASDLTRRDVWKKLRERHQMSPEIHYVVDTSGSADYVEDIKVRILNLGESKHTVKRFGLYELLLPRFWSKLYGSDIDLLPDFHPGFFPTEGSLKEREVGTSIAAKRWPPVKIFERIFEFCLENGGVAKISRNQFALWLCRLHWVANDIDRMLSCGDKEWTSYQTKIAEIVADENSDHFESYDKGRWEPFVKGQSLTLKVALKNRVRDARELLNSSLSLRTESDDAISKFLHKCSLSFGRRLCRAKLLIQCQHCRDFALFRIAKKYCSRIEESKDCRTTAKNARHYQRHKEEIREKAQRTMRETRQYLRVKGVRKS